MPYWLELCLWVLMLAGGVLMFFGCYFLAQSAGDMREIAEILNREQDRRETLRRKLVDQEMRRD